MRCGVHCGVVLVMGVLIAPACGPPVGKGGAEQQAPEDTGLVGDGADGTGDGVADGGGTTDGGSGADGAPPDTGPIDTGPGTSDGGDPWETERCPQGMVGVPTDEPLYCIDQYEVLVEGGVALSVAGAIPSSTISFQGARDVCAATPAVDASGTVVGVKRIASAEEWEDAADGVVGPGGARFPYGNVWEDRRCATPDLDGTVWLTELQPTGALEGCVSAFGFHDAIGNQWEWMDSGAITDTAAALARFSDIGVRLWVEPDGGISVLEGDPSRLRVFVITAPTEVTVVDGRLFLPTPPLMPAEPNGYLLAEGDRPWVGYAPIVIREGDGGYWIDSYPAGEGQPVPDKRGCAWYVGRPGDGGCDLDAAIYMHTPTFSGSISFRCAADPLP